MDLVASDLVLTPKRLKLGSVWMPMPKVGAYVAMRLSWCEACESFDGVLGRSCSRRIAFEACPTLSRLDCDVCVMIPERYP